MNDQVTRLVPVVEIEPWSYSDRSSPEAATTTSAARQEYYQLCLRDAGLEHLQPVASDSMFYELSQLREAHVVTALARHELESWSDIECYSSREQVLEHGSSLYGGLAILRGAGLLSTPGCCCMLDTIRDEWTPALKAEPSEWTELWVGHDVDRLKIRFDAESNEFRFRLAHWETTKIPDWDRTYRLDGDLFRRMLENAARELTHLAQDLSSALPETVSGPLRDLVANRMAGLL